ncbi:CBS domain-containing protein [Polynucleobacter paneuropaeus]|nr:CBS domain-containing protein [Polynucleobacter paneuropaeus]
MNQLLNDLVIQNSENVFLAVKKIESSRIQSVFVVDKENRLLGIITNGDVRRFLLNGGSVDSKVVECMNQGFKAVGVDATTEDLLKLLDLGYSVIPKLDADGKLIDCITHEYKLASPETPVLARSRAPVRVSFGGGGSDLTYYFIDYPGLILSTTVALYCHVTLVPRPDQAISIYSDDLNTENHYSTLINLLENPTHNLLTSVISVIKPTYGFDLYVRSDFPVGSGLGGSSAVATAVVAAFNELRLDHWTPYEIAELAFHAERLCFGVAGGWQDQYASAFGGFNLIELDDKKNLVHAIRLEDSVLNELEECLILCDTDIKHDSGDLHQKQRETYNTEDKSEQLKAVVALCRTMHRHLIRGELIEFGRCLHQAWELKKNLSTSITNQQIEVIYNSAIEAGALGGKLLGAGAGGFFLFFVKPQNRASVTKVLRNLGCKISTFKFETEGVVSWRTKIL